MKAFEVLDQENKGYLTTEELTKYMCEEGINFCHDSAVCFSELLGQGKRVLVGLYGKTKGRSIQAANTAEVYVAQRKYKQQNDSAKGSRHHWLPASCLFGFFCGLGRFKCQCK